MSSIILLKKKTKKAMASLVSRYKNLLDKSDAVIDKEGELPEKIDILYVENGVDVVNVAGYTPLFYKRVEFIDLSKSKTKLVGKVTKMEKI